METQVMQPTTVPPTNYYEHIASHPQTADFYLLHDHDAIGFILAMGRIDLPGAPFSSGKELLDFVLNNRHLGTPQILFPHKTVIVFFTLDGQRPVVVVSTSAMRMNTALNDLIAQIAPPTRETLDYLIQEHAEVDIEPLPEDPADAVIIYRPDLILLSDCYQDLRKLGYSGIIMVPGLIDIPYEHWKGGVHAVVTPVMDRSTEGFVDFEHETLWDEVYYYIPKQYLTAESSTLPLAA
jgi:hypothetical protein